MLVIITNNAFSVKEGESGTISESYLLATDADNSDSEITYTLEGESLHGILKLDGKNLDEGSSFTQKDIGDKKLTYTHNNSNNHNDQFLFTVSDGNGGTTEQNTFIINIGEVAHPPTAIDREVSTVEDKEIPITFTATDEDDDPIVQWEIVASPQKGSISGSGKNRVYKPELNYTGVDSFTFKAYDGSLWSAPAKIKITIGAVNDPPIFQQSPGSIDNKAQLGKTYSVSVRANDVDNGTPSYKFIGNSPTDAEYKNGKVQWSVDYTKYRVGQTQDIEFVAEDNGGAKDTLKWAVTIEGHQWEYLGEVPYHDDLYNVKCAAANANHIYVAKSLLNQDGIRIYKSTNGGSSWNLFKDTISGSLSYNYYPTSLRVVNNTIIVVGAGDGGRHPIYKIFDNVGLERFHYNFPKKWFNGSAIGQDGRIFISGHKECYMCNETNPFLYDEDSSIDSMISNGGGTIQEWDELGCYHDIEALDEYVFAIGSSYPDHDRGILYRKSINNTPYPSEGWKVIGQMEGYDKIETDKNQGMVFFLIDVSNAVIKITKNGLTSSPTFDEITVQKENGNVVTPKDIWMKSDKLG